MPKTTSPQLIETLSYKDDDVGSLETVYDQRLNKSQIARLKDGKVEFLDQIELKDGRVLRPWSALNSLISHGFIKLPSYADPYPDELNLYKELLGFVNSRVALPESFAPVATLYIMMTWLYDSFRALPYLRVIGVPGTGKTTFLQTVGSLCYKAMFGSGSTSLAALFRTIDQVQGTFVFDEADFRATEMSNEVTKVLNAGYVPGSPVLRMEPDPKNDKLMNTRAFQCFGPKIIASRESFSDEALESRCLTQIMPIRNELETPLVQPRSFDNEALALRNKLLYFRLQHTNDPEPSAAEMESIKLLRLRQIILPLMHIARMVGGDAEQQLTYFAEMHEVSMTQERLRMTEADVLVCILFLLENQKSTKAEKVRISQIADEFNARYIGEYASSRMPDLPDRRDLVRQGHYVSARKIGHIVSRKLHIKTLRDADGFYIHPAEAANIKQIADRYGITPDMVYGGNED